MPLDCRMARKPKEDQISLFSTPEASGSIRLESLHWPPNDRFPLNILGRRVRDAVIADLASSRSPLIVAGYSAIDYLMDCAHQIDPTDAPLRILLGNEPFPGDRSSYATADTSFPREVEEYWLHRGISLRLSARIVATIELIRTGRLTSRYLGGEQSRLHAKIYSGDSGITIGSSNFTQAGLTRQIEANVRLTPKDKKWFQEARTVAENLWTAGIPYDTELLALLEKLLRVVSWQEALARASAELLEGEWAREYLEAQLYVGDLPLWPSQEQGIAEAMWVLANVGSVLVADATGSGKTRLGAHLIRATVDRIWRHGRARKAPAVVVAPPAVKANWRHAAREAGVALDVQSHGKLSYSTSRTHDSVVDAVRRAQVLAIDEAHNFLNPNSRRTRAILGNMADHAILFTATPINKSATDLLRLADMLGADNLADSTLQAFSALLRRPKLDRTLSQGELAALRRELQRFTVRRTKRALNAMVDEAPMAYRDAAGKPCRYPEHRAHTYALHESDADRDLARRIRETAGRLRGVALLASQLEMPDVLRRENWTEEKYLESRLRTASRLSAYLVMATLRSSAVALFEHVMGTRAALERFGLELDAKRQATGDMCGRLRQMRGSPPTSKLTVPLPDWLRDADAHRHACDEDIQAYEEVLELAGRMSDRREIAKAGLLRKLSRRHGMIVAFDSRPITLSVLKKHLAVLDAGTEVILATGERKSARREVEDRLRHGADRETRRLIALCSDSMSEGVNLQKAAAVVHLDLPSVVRIAEQRVGRVDRMDSPNKAIEAWWPQDAPELALRSDERFVERYETVENLLGSNLPLPEGFASTPSNASEVVSADQIIKEFAAEQEREPWDGLQDVFGPVRDLVNGPDALVPHSVYEHYRGVTSRVLSRVSFVDAGERWALACFTGSRIGAPRWIFVRDDPPEVVADLMEIAAALRQRLGPATVDVKLSDAGMRWLDRVLTIAREQDRALLPRRKRRALEEMQVILDSYTVGPVNSSESETQLRRLLDILARDSLHECYDWDAIAEGWLDLIRPVWYERLTTRKRLRPLLLKDIRRDLLGPRRLPLEQILTRFESLPTLPPLDERVAACIIGLPSR